MKKMLFSLAAALVTLTAAADEGMWLLPYLQKMNIGDMKAKGCQLSAEDIYAVNASSLKDAIVIFGGGCTGEIVSPEGLLFTNHHCGYGSIQSLSSVEHDYLKNGFWAQNRAEELPAPGLEVRFIRKIADVSDRILGNVPSISGGGERNKIVRENSLALQKELEAENPGHEVQIKSFFGGNQYFAFVMEVYKDVRLVGTPPTSIGKFGGETDNWMWPRHTGDFSVFRVYAGKDNRPAEYAPENVPYQADRYLKISLDGYREGDFAMIMGFPGSTQRYMTTSELDAVMDITHPQRVYIRGERQAILKEDMAASDRVRIQYASKYASSSNYWKNSIGQMRGIAKLNVRAKKAEQEAAFRQWAETQTLPEERFMEALTMIGQAMAEARPIMASQQYISEAFMTAVEILKPARLKFLKEGEIDTEALDGLRTELKKFYKDYNEPTDRRVAHRMLRIVRENAADLPSFYTEVIDKEFGGDIDAYVDYLYDHSVFATEERAMAFLEAPSAETLKADPAVRMYASVLEKMRELVQRQAPLTVQLNEGRRLYIAGLMRMNPDRAWAPDANFTIRLTYGQVLPYDPRDGVQYNYYTTLRGVIEKEDPSNPVEFTVPEKIKALYAAKDFGPYANDRGELPVAFLANCDITGGNSGSPIMNARGELLGLAFDGNWEAMSGDVAFEPELQRTISVDIRYVLFVIDKYAGAGWLLDELTLVKTEPDETPAADTPVAPKKTKKSKKNSR